MATRRHFIAGLIAAFAAATGIPAPGSVSNDGTSRIKNPRRPARLDPHENPQKLLLDWYTAAKEMQNSDPRIGLSAKEAAERMLESIEPIAKRIAGRICAKEAL